MTLLAPGTELEGWVVEGCLHPGRTAHLYRVHCAPGTPDPGFPLVMKVPHRGEGEGAATLLRFEVEQQILPALTGPHVPRFVAAGDLAQAPYLVMEDVPGQSLARWLDSPALPAIEAVVQVGVALARAVHSLHRQDTVHLDLKPDNVLLREDGSVVLLDYSRSCHAHYPDLLAGESPRALGSPASMAPEQVLGVRVDPRSDIFAIGVLLYQLLTHELPFGAPETDAGLRQRLWRPPTPPQRHRPELPAWLQEVVLRCLASEAAQRYPSAAHLALDLQHPQLMLTDSRAEGRRGLAAWAWLQRGLRAVRPYQPSPLPRRGLAEVPIVMVAVPPDETREDRLHALREAAARALGTRPGARLLCVTVMAPDTRAAESEPRSEASMHRRHLLPLRQWAQPLEQTGHAISCHLLESTDVAQALLDDARDKCVSTIVLGAAPHGLALQRKLDTVPMAVALQAPCTVILVKQALPFEQLTAAQKKGS